MIDASMLKSQTVKDLAEMARKKGVPGWHSLRKDQLVKILMRLRKSMTSVAGKSARAALAKRSTNGNGNGNGHGKSVCHANGSRLSNGSKSANGVKPSNGVKATNGAKPANGAPLSAEAKAKNRRIERRLKEIREKLAFSKDLASSASNGNGHSHSKDRLVAIVLDPFWIQAYWELSRHSVDRAKVAMGQNWHGARPVLRVHAIAVEGTTSSAREVVQQVEVHGGVKTWYVHVQDPPKSYQLDIGYLAVCGKFYALARSNVVKTPPVGASESFDRNWTGVARDYDRIYAQSGGYGEGNGNEELREVFEEHLRRPMGPPMVTRLGLAAGACVGKDRRLNLDVDAELVVFGTTQPDAHLTLKGEPVRLQPDGSFLVRFNLPDRRQVLPVVASSGDGSEQRTVVLAVERNTKVMEPVVRESGE